MFTNRLFHLLILAVILALTACAPQVEPASTAAPTTAPAYTATLAPTSTPTIEPTGTVQPTKTATKIPVYLPFQPGKFVHHNDATSYFTFREDGRWAHYVGGTLLASGTYRVEGDTYILTSISSGCTVPMSFKFSFDGTYLKFQLTDESRNSASCPYRGGYFDNTTYIFSP